MTGIFDMGQIAVNAVFGGGTQSAAQAEINEHPAAWAAAIARAQLEAPSNAWTIPPPDPRPPGIYWTRTGSRTQRVEIVR